MRSLSLYFHVVNHEVSATVGMPGLRPGSLFTFSSMPAFLYNRIDSAGSLNWPTLKQVPVGYNIVSITNEGTGGAANIKIDVRRSFELSLPPVECKGYATANPARAYYPVPMEFYTPGEDAPTHVLPPEVVQVSAKALDGYVFVGWEGEGICYTEAISTGDSWAIWSGSQPIALSETTSANSTIWIELDSSKTLTPKFEDGCYTVMNVRSCGGGPTILDWSEFGNWDEFWDWGGRTGHSWIEVREPCGASWESYGLYGNGVLKHEDLNWWPQTPQNIQDGWVCGVRYYCVTKDKYEALMAFIDSTPDDAWSFPIDPSSIESFYACTHWAIDCVSIAHGEQLHGGPDPLGIPKLLAQDILTKEAMQATSEEEPLPPL